MGMCGTVIEPTWYTWHNRHLPAPSRTEESRDRMRAIRVMPLRHDEVMHFTKLVHSDVSPNYPGTESTYAISLAQSHFTGTPTGSLFTVGREIWTIKYGDDSIGFVVCSLKIGGSVKIGPIAIDPEARDHGFGGQAVDLLHREYVARGFRRLYMTAPVGGDAIVGLAVSHGFKHEATMRRHFRVDSDELIFGRNHSANISSGHESSILHTENWTLSSQFDDTDDKLERHLERAIAAASESPSTGPYVHISPTGRDRFQWGAFLNMKRGGAVRIGPIHWHGSEADANQFVSSILQLEWVKHARRRFLVIPVRQFEILAPSLRDFEIEGTLLRPYNSEEDAVVLGSSSLDVIRFI